MTSSDYRRIARDNLRGNWGNAVLVAFVASIFGGLLNSSASSLNIDTETLAELPEPVLEVLLFVASIASVLSFVCFILGGVVRQGYCVYLLKQYDGKPGELKDLFSQFHRFGDGFLLALLEGLYTFLWALLFIIPGIVASYSYAMAPFILLENPDMTANEALRASKAMMNGHKMELLCLDLSFIGWNLLNVFTLGIGSLWLNPYQNAARTAFFRSFRSFRSSRIIDSTAVPYSGTVNY